MIAYHYPPVKGSSGVLRTLKYSRYLPENGWQPTILTVQPSAYPSTSEDQVREIPPDVHVERAFALDSKRHLSIRGRYFRGLALPDRWVSWLAGAVPAGLRLIRERQPHAIWSTFPVPTAHLIGWVLHRLTGLPWVADFRDPMCQPDYPTNPKEYRAFQWIERRVVHSCSAATFTAPTAVEMYRNRYPDIASDRWRLLPNGYDEDDFPATSPGPPPLDGRPLKLVHSGLLYPSERDPSAFFQALVRLKATGEIDAGGVRVVLRATGYDEIYRPMLQQMGLSELVELVPALPYREAIDEMLSSDGLLLLQAANCNFQVPAKAYEYLRSGRPILTLTDPTGDTAALIRTAPNTRLADLSDADSIHAALIEFLAVVRGARVSLPPTTSVRQYSRRRQSARLAELLEFAAAAGRADGRLAMVGAKTTW